MDIFIDEYSGKNLKQVTEIWNEVVRNDGAFPQIDLLTEESAAKFFADQSYVGVAEYGGKAVGMYILHPNNVGRCSHQANASYAVSPEFRGRKIGEKLVRHSLEKARELGFKLLVFNAVVMDNYSAIHLYEKLGFKKIGEMPNGYRLDSENYKDIILYYHEL